MVAELHLPTVNHQNLNLAHCIKQRSVNNKHTQFEAFRAATRAATTSAKLELILRMQLKFSLQAPFSRNAMNGHQNLDPLLVLILRLQWQPFCCLL